MFRTLFSFSETVLHAWDFFLDEVQTVVNGLMFIAISCNGGQLMFSNPATLL